MSITPNAMEQIARARTDMRQGLPFVIADGGDGLLVVAAETVNEDRFGFFVAHRNPAPVVTLTAWRAATLKARIYDDDIARIILPPDVGIAWLRCLADPARDLDMPLKGPLQTLRDGQARLHRMAIAMAKSAQVLPAVLALTIDNPAAFAQAHDLNILPVDAIDENLTHEHAPFPVAAGQIPLAAAGAGRVHVFRPADGGAEHYAIEIGRPARNHPVLTRLHSACFTGDVLGSLKCDCGPQLHKALADMGEVGEGLLIYLNQEGRGIGLANKMRAYTLQDQGFDTVEANHRLGFEDDERDFRIGAHIIKTMGFGSIRLMTNNPRKVDMMQAMGITVTDRVPLIVGKNPHNAAYLAVKAQKSGHLL